MELVQTTPAQEVAVFCLSCGFLSNATTVSSEIDDCRAFIETHPRSRVLLDLAGLDYYPSAGLGRLVELARKAAAAQVTLKMCSARAQVLELVSLLDMGAVLNLYSTKTDALAAFANGGREEK